MLVFNLLLAKSKNENPLVLIAEHVALAVGVIVLSYFVGTLIGKFFI